MRLQSMDTSPEAERVQKEQAQQLQTGKQDQKEQGQQLSLFDEESDK